jgi:hypothetical protein
MSRKQKTRPEPCSTCPYRQDAPSGLWSEHEYEKLRDYDLPTGSQPFSSFACHSSPAALCAGWVAVHQNRGHEYELLALRIHPAEQPEVTTPLWSSGNEAADHGERDLDHPSDEAKAAAEKVMRKIARRA